MMKKSFENWGYEKKALASYMILLVTMSYVLFHHSMFSYFKPTEFNYLSDQALDHGRSEEINPERIILDHLYLPLLKFADWNPVPVRLFFQSLIVFCLFGLFWFRKLDRGQPIANRLILCLAIATTPFLISVRDLPEGLTFAITCIAIILLVNGVAQFLFHNADRPKASTLACLGCAPLLTGPTAYIWLLPVLILSWKSTEGQRRYVPAILLSMVLPIGLAYGLTAFRHDPLLFEATTSENLQALAKAAGWWFYFGIGLGLTSVSLSIKSKDKPKLFLWSIWFLILIIHSLTGSCKYAFLAVNAIIISDTIVFLMEYLSRSISRNKIRAIWLLLLALFVAGPFAAGTHIHSSKKLKEAIAIEEAISMVRSHKDIFKETVIAPLGRGTNPANALSLLLFDNARNSEYDIQSRVLPDSIHFLTDQLQIETLQKNYFIKEHARVEGLVLIELSDVPFQRIAASLDEAQSRLEKKIVGIKENTDWMRALKEKAQKNGIAVDEQIRMDAGWSLREEGLISNSQYDSLITRRGD